jgi:flagellar motility protein MotE (MotC chaperone)
MLQEEARLLAAERDELDGRSLVLKEAEIENLKNLAAGIEKMGAAAAAGLLQEMTHERVAKILSFMKPRERGKILAAMPPEFASKVSDRLLGLLKPETGGTSNAANTAGNE